MQITTATQCTADITTLKQKYLIKTVDNSIIVNSTIFEAMEKADRLYPDANIAVIIEDSDGKPITMRLQKDADPDKCPGVKQHSNDEKYPYHYWSTLL